MYHIRLSEIQLFHSYFILKSFIHMSMYIANILPVLYKGFQSNKHGSDIDNKKLDKTFCHFAFCHCVKLSRESIRNFGSMFVTSILFKIISYMVYCYNFTWWALDDIDIWKYKQNQSKRLAEQFPLYVKLYGVKVHNHYLSYCLKIKTTKKTIHAISILTSWKIWPMCEWSWPLTEIDAKLFPSLHFCYICLKTVHLEDLHRLFWQLYVTQILLLLFCHSPKAIEEILELTYRKYWM
jgi:hypothetical protein